MIENSSAGHLLYTNRWNLHKARDWKASPSAVHTGWDLFYSLRWAGTKWMVARKGRAQFRAQFSDENNFRDEKARDSEKVWRRGCHSYWGATLSDLATGRILSRALSFVVVIYVTHRHTTADQQRHFQSHIQEPDTKWDWIIKCEKHFWCNSRWCTLSSHVIDFNGGWIMNVVLNCNGRIME